MSGRDEHRRVCVKYLLAGRFLAGLLLEADEFDDLLSLRGLRVDLLVLDLLGVPLLLDVWVEKLEQEILVVDRLNPDLAVRTLVVVKLGLQLLLDKLLLLCTT